MKRLAIVTLALSLGGCTAAIKGYPDTSLGQGDKTYLTEEYPSVMTDRAIPSSVRTKAERNKIIDARLYLLDFQFSKFEKALYRQGLISDIGTDWLLLGLAAVTATTGGEKTKEVLGVASATVVGAKAAFDKRALLEKSVTALLAQMRADRAKVLVDIQTGANQPLDQYPLGRAIRDLDRYYQAGTLPSALNTVVVNASVQEKVATDQLKELRSESYIRDDSGDAINGFWRPGGAKNTDHDAAIRKWMTDNGYKAGPGDVTMFIRSDSPAVAKDRARMVNDLQIKDWLLKNTPAAAAAGDDGGR